MSFSSHAGTAAAAKEVRSPAAREGTAHCRDRSRLFADSSHGSATWLESGTGFRRVRSVEAEPRLIEWRPRYPHGAAIVRHQRKGEPMRHAIILSAALAAAPAA